MSGFAFASIYKEPIPPGPGPGPGPSPDPGPDPEPDPTYTISGTSIVPFIPFTVTVTASSDKAHGSGGHLQYSADYNIVVLDDGGSWSSGASHTWTLYTRRCDSSLNSMQFSWLINGKEPVTAMLGYNAGTMTPNIVESTVEIGSTFDFTITFSGHGANCKARSLSDFGATYWWEAQKAGKWERTNRIPVNQTPSFSNGVLSGKGYVGNLVGYDKIRLCVDYAGNETASDEAALTSSAVTITLGSNSLHCFGASTSLKIESGSLELMTAAFYRGDNTTEEITDTNGTPIAFSFSGTTWTGNIQASTAATAGAVVLKVFYNNEVVATKQINVVTELFGEIEADTPIMQGESIEASATFDGGDYTLTRIPANVVELMLDSGASEYNLVGEDSIELSYLPTSGGTYILTLLDTKNATVLDTLEVSVTAIQTALEEAIRERLIAKGETSGLDHIAADFYNAAINAMAGYLKTDVDADTGTYTEFDYQNHGITFPETITQEWCNDTYNKVIQATKRGIASNSYLTRTSWRKSAYVSENQTRDYVDGQYVYEDISNTISRAKSKASATWAATDFSSSQSVNQSIHGYSYIGINSHSVSARLSQNKIQLRLNTLPTVACTVYIYSGIGKYDSDTTFNKMGAAIADNGYFGIIGSYEQGTETLVMSPIIIDANINFSNNTGTSSSAYGFQGGNLPVILDYHFKHK